MDRGEKDIYKLNDTHWSPKAAKIVGEYVGQMIINADIDSLQTISKETTVVQ